MAAVRAGARFPSARSVMLRCVMALRDAIKNGAVSGKPVRPPNLGAAPAGSTRFCANCRYFRSAGLRGGNCRLYGGYPVKANMVSDSFAKRG